MQVPVLGANRADRGRVVPTPAKLCPSTKASTPQTSNAKQQFSPPPKSMLGRAAQASQRLGHFPSDSILTAQTSPSSTTQQSNSTAQQKTRLATRMQRKRAVAHLQHILREAIRGLGRPQSQHLACPSSSFRSSCPKAPGARFVQFCLRANEKISRTLLAWMPPHVSVQSCAPESERWRLLRTSCISS